MRRAKAGAKPFFSNRDLGGRHQAPVKVFAHFSAGVCNLQVRGAAIYFRRMCRRMVKMGCFHPELSQTPYGSLLWFPLSSRWFS